MADTQHRPGSWLEDGGYLVPLPTARTPSMSIPFNPARDLLMKKAN